jgi:hypothetical protein
VSSTPLTDRDLEILDVLTRRVRVLTIPQLARTWWSHATDPEGTASKRIKALGCAGLVEIFPAPCHPELYLPTPVFTWHPHNPPPDFGAISYALQSRWTNRPQLLRAVIATNAAGTRFGGHGGKRPREVEHTHDVHLASVYLHIRQLDPEAAQHWMFETEIQKRRDTKRAKLPDAFIPCPDPPRFVEFGGAYSKAKVEAFHHYCAQLAITYEIW